MKQKLISYFLLLTVALSSAACNLVITPPPPAQLNPNSVIFTAEQSEASLDAVDSDAESTWTPTEADIAKLEAALPSFLESAENEWLQDDPPIEERIADYMRQYLGIVEKGEQIIYANFFCTINDMDWRNQYVLVMDGGDCFLQVKYNPESGEFFDLSVNGPG
jgi:hypothetical protein